MINGYRLLNGAKYSSELFQNYLVFIPAKNNIECFNATTRIYSWKSNRISEESIENINRSGSLFPPTFVNHYILPDVSFNGHCLNFYSQKGNKSIYFLHNKSLFKKFKHRFYINNCVLGSVEPTKNADPGKYKNSDYPKGFDLLSEFSFTDGNVGKMSLFLELI